MIMSIWKAFVNVEFLVSACEILIQLVQMGFPDSAFPESSPDDFTEQIGF